MNKTLLAEYMDFSQDMDDDTFMKLSRTIDDAVLKTKSKYDAEFDLLSLGKSLCSIQRALISGIRAG